MPQNITLGYRALVDAANKEVETVPTAEAIKLAGRDDVLLVDVRDYPRTGARGQGTRRLPLSARNAGVLD